MFSKRAMVLVGSAMLIGFSGLTPRVSVAAAELSDGPEVVETQPATHSDTQFNMPGVVPKTSTSSDPQLECFVNGGEWSTYTNECVLEQPD